MSGVYRRRFPTQGAPRARRRRALANVLHVEPPAVVTKFIVWVMQWFS